MNWKRIEQKILKDKPLTEEDKEDIIKSTDEYWDDHPDVASRFPRWRKYLAWTAGYQLYDYNKIARKLVQVPLARESKLVFNKIKSYVRTLLSKLTAEIPQMSVIPNTDEYADIRAAEIGDKVISGLENKVKFIQQLNNAKLWLIITNRAFMRVFWDESSGGPVGYGHKEEGSLSGTQEAEPSTAGGESQEVDFEPVLDEGEIRITSVSPFNCRVDPLYYAHDDWRWFMYGSDVDAKEVEREYDIESGSLKDTSSTMETAYQLDLTDDTEGIIGAPSKNTNVVGRSIVKKEFWTPKIWIFIAGGKVLDWGKNEYETIPFYFSEERLIPIDTYQKEFQYNEGFIKDLIPIQREYNRMQSIQSIALDRASKLKIMTPIGSLLSKKQFTNDYATFIDYNPRAGTIPFQMKMDPFPVEMDNYKGGLERDMEGSISLGPASFGRLPERASHASGTLVNILLEQDEVVLNPLLNQINDMIADVWTLALRIVQNNYTTERLIKYVGEDGQNDVIKFKGADLRGNTDVRVTTQSGLPRSRALKVEYVMKLREAGLLTDDKSTLQMLQFGQAEKIFKDVLVHERKATRENEKIKKDFMTIQARPGQPGNLETGQPPVPPTDNLIYQLDDHMAHMNIHLRLRLGTEFDLINPQSQQILENHIQAHLGFLQPPPPSPGPGGPGNPNEQAPPAPPGQPAGPATAAPGQ